MVVELIFAMVREKREVMPRLNGICYKWTQSMNMTPVSPRKLVGVATLALPPACAQFRPVRHLRHSLASLTPLRVIRHYP